MEDYIRPITKQDMMLIYEWANDSCVRENSFSSEKINLDDHIRWFNKVIQDEKCLFFIYMHKGYPIGQIRLDINKDTGSISYSIAREYRGQGFGTKMIECMEQLIKEEKISVKRLIGEVKMGNIPSQHVFEKLGYSGKSLIRYEKKIGD